MSVLEAYGILYHIGAPHIALHPSLQTGEIERALKREEDKDT
jgi:hypothetical protein